MLFEFISVDRCGDCDMHAYCEHGHCVCQSGFFGSGYSGDCKKVNDGMPYLQLFDDNMFLYFLVFFVSNFLVIQSCFQVINTIEVFDNDQKYSLHLLLN